MKATLLALSSKVIQSQSLQLEELKLVKRISRPTYEQLIEKNNYRMIERLDDSNFLLYAAKHYDNPQCFDTLEFYEDLKRFKYIKRLFNRYIEEGDLKDRLILNHIVVLFNLFGVRPAVRMLFLKCRGQESILVPFLIALNNLPDKVENIGLENKTILTSDIVIDINVANALRKL